jgi:hypothetical protein
MPDTQLNVIFHGLFVFVERPDIIEVLIPDMGAQHVYRAGEWLGETTFAPGHYELTGTSSGGDPFDGTKNLIFTGLEPESSDDGVYARLTLRRPKKIYSLRPITLDQSSLSLQSEDLVSSRTVSTIQVFNYTIDDPTQVKLSDHPINTSAELVNGSFFMSLHIIAGPDQPELPEHTQLGFSSAIGLLPGMTGKVRLLSSPKVPPPKRSDVPPGLIFEELIDLSVRTEQLGIHGRHVREVLGANPLATIQSSADFVGVDDDVHTCAGAITRLHG